MSQQQRTLRLAGAQQRDSWTVLQPRDQGMQCLFRSVLSHTKSCQSRQNSKETRHADRSSQCQRFLARMHCGLHCKAVLALFGSARHSNHRPVSLCCSASGAAQQQQLVVHGAMNGKANDISKALLLPTAAGGNKEYTPSAAVARRLPSKWPRPVWHPPWKLFRVISGHLG